MPCRWPSMALRVVLGASSLVVTSSCASDADDPTDGGEGVGHVHDAHVHEGGVDVSPGYRPDGGSGEGAADENDAGAVDAGADDAEAVAEAYVWDLPEGWPAPDVPENNPMSEAKVLLGRHLFYDVQLSENGTQACASCHEQALGFAQSVPVPTGSTGQPHARNSMPLANVAFLSSYTWVNPNLLTLERQIAVPLFGDRPVELGVTDQEIILERLRGSEIYPALFAEAFPRDDEPIDFGHLVDAIACFLRSLISLDSPYDRYQRGEQDALSAAATRGMNLFFGEELECHHCHNSFMFTNAVWTSKSAFRDFAYNNTGLYNLDEMGAYPEESPGLYEFTGELGDHGKFRTPSLRNVGVTAPYFHDGSAATLEEVVRTYERGGRRIESGPHAGDGSDNPNKSGLVPGFELTDAQRADLIAFLQSLTDETFLSDPRHASPFE